METLENSEKSKSKKWKKREKRKKWKKLEVWKSGSGKAEYPININLDKFDTE